MQISTQELFYFFGFVLILFLCCQALLVNGELMRRPGVALAAELCANDMFFCQLCSICVLYVGLAQWFGAMCSLTLHDIAVM